MPDPGLQTLQSWMSRVIQHPETSDVAAAEEAARALIPRGALVAGEVIKPSTKMEPLQRMDVYNGAYLSRLIEVLQSDYAGLEYALGDERWFQLAKTYVAHYPSHHPNLNQFGKHLPGFVAEQDFEDGAFLAELARLQWTVVESFDAPEFESLDMQDLASLTQEQWADVVLRANPSVRLFESSYPVNRFLQAFYDGDEPSTPDLADSRLADLPQGRPRLAGRPAHARLPHPGSTGGRRALRARARSGRREPRRGHHALVPGVVRRRRVCRGRDPRAPRE